MRGSYSLQTTVQNDISLTGDFVSTIFCSTMNNETTRPTPTGQSRTLAQWLASVLRHAADALAAGTAKRPTIAAIKNDLAYDVEVEFLDLTWAQVDMPPVSPLRPLDLGVVRMPRAKQRGRAIFDNVAVSPRLRALLDRLPRTDGCPYLFTNRDGNPWNSGSFKSLWSRSMLDAIAEGVITKQQRFTFHSLRRFYTTMHRAQHGDLPDLHADKRITSRVYDATKEIGRKAL